LPADAGCNPRYIQGIQRASDAIHGRFRPHRRTIPQEKFSMPSLARQMLPLVFALVAFQTRCIVAETFSLGPSADLTVSSASPDSNYGGAGAIADFHTRGRSVRFRIFQLAKLQYAGKSSGIDAGGHRRAGAGDRWIGDNGIVDSTFSRSSPAPKCDSKVMEDGVTSGEYERISRRALAPG
jgi:hypothetical protein